MSETTPSSRVRELVGRSRWTATVAFALTATVLAGVGAAYAFQRESQLLFYPSTVLLGASVTYLGAPLVGAVDYDSLGSAVPDGRVLDALLSVSVALTVALSRTTVVGLRESYYWFLPVVALLFAIRILKGPSRRTLYLLVLYAVAVRAAIWFSVPMVGTDTHVHLALARFVAQSGDLPPSSVSYYHWYPMAHVAAAVTSQLSAASMKQAFFLTTGAYAAVSVTAVYLFTGAVLGDVLDRRDRRRAALFAGLVVAVAPWYVRRTSVVIAQSMALATVPFALYAAVRFRERAFAVLFVSFATLVTFTHNLTPAVLAFVLTMLFVSNRTVEKLGAYVPDWRATNLGFGISVVTAVGLLTLQYWLFIGYFDLQVLRVAILLFGGSSVSEVAQQSGLSSDTAFTLADLFLHIGIEQLVFGAVLALFGYVALGGTHRSESFEDVPMGLYVAASVVFLVLSVSLVVGWEANVVRALPNITLVVAPVFGYLLVRTVESESATAVVLVGLLLVFPAIGGLAATVGTVNPAISPTEEVGSNRFVTAPQRAATDHVLRWAGASATYATTDVLASAANYRNAVRDGEIRVRERGVGVPLMNVPRPVRTLGAHSEVNRSMVQRYVGSAPNRYYVDPARSGQSLRPLSSPCSTVYDAGDVTVVTC